MALENLGVAVAPPVAFIQEYLGTGLKGRSWYLSEFVDGPSCLITCPLLTIKLYRRTGYGTDHRYIEVAMEPPHYAW